MMGQEKKLEENRAEGRKGPKLAELYGKYTWKIDTFSQINKRELRSNAFEVGGYKWYILIYPQECHVCNHLSLFLCVANHDKLLPGWSHFAQFTIALINKDPKKSKYSDTLHRFWKKEHDWGWKKFMELSKVVDGFIDADTLTIKAQVQVIRQREQSVPSNALTVNIGENFRAGLSPERTISTVGWDVTGVSRALMVRDAHRNQGPGSGRDRMVSEPLLCRPCRQIPVSFYAFWLGIDQNSRRRMSREKSDWILEMVVNSFFIEKEVTSTLVMDSWYSGLKALMQREQTIPVVSMEKDMFVLVDDVLLLLEKAALEPSPLKDEKGPQSRTKDGTSGEDTNRDSIQCDERCLTELGRRTIEIFVLAHIFSKIEVGYREAVALKRQEELIYKEAAWLAETEQKAKRASEKGKRSKKKQVPGQVLGKPGVLEEISDISDSIDSVNHPDSEDRDASPVNWDTNTSEVHQSVEAGCSASKNGIA
ncbi:MATH domain-containing protein [Capsicum annuum]|nr:MATH domain-containing protein [Capsicum annuum]